MASRALQQNNLAETLIGALVVAVAVLFCAFAYMRTGSGSFSSGYEVLARLPKVDGLGVGTDVRISGIKVGSVTGMVLDTKNYLVTVKMNVRDDIKLPTDSSMMITSSGILGSSYLSIAPGGDDTDIKPGGYIENTQAANSADLMSLAGRFIGGDAGKPAPKPAAPGGTQPVKRVIVLAASVAMAGAAFGQSASVNMTPSPTKVSTAKTAAPSIPVPAAPAASPASVATSGSVLLLRGLDKITGRPTNITAPIGKPVQFATLTITARYCYSTPPSETPETTAFVQIEDHRPDQPARRIFSGWMYASSPGLNGVEHPLYDVWAITCRGGAAPQMALTSTAPVKVAAPDSSDKDTVTELPAEAGR